MDRVHNKRRRLLKCGLHVVLVLLIAWVVCDLSQLSYDNRYAFGFDALGIWAFAVTASLIGHFLMPSTEHRIRKLIGVLSCYVVSYAALSADGKYYFGRSGTLRSSFGLSVSDRSIWFPKSLYFERHVDINGKHTSRGSVLGYYFSPLIIVDRAWVHPTDDFFADTSPSTKHAK